MILRRKKFLVLSSLLIIIGLTLAACQPFATISDRLSEEAKIYSEKENLYSYLTADLVNLRTEKFPLSASIGAENFSLTDQLLAAESEYAYIRSDIEKDSSTESTVSSAPGVLANIQSGILPEVAGYRVASSATEASEMKVLANLMREPRILIEHPRFTGKLVNLKSSIQPEVFVLGVEEKDKSLTLQQVTSPGPGWVVIHADEKGSPGEILGYVSVEEGVSFDVVVEAPSNQYGETIHAMLHVDKGIIGQLEFPQGPDRPVYAGSRLISKPISLMER